MALCSDSISNSNAICGIVVVGIISNSIVDSIIPTRFVDIAPRSEIVPPIVESLAAD
jgi:hypothetical protein